MKSYTADALPKQIKNYDHLIETFTKIQRNDWLYPDNLGFFRNILASLGNPEKNLGSIVHVTGTYGRGSVAWKVARSIQAKFPKTKVGLYVSPHIYEFEERISINGATISKEDMVIYANYVFDILKSKATDDQLIGMFGILVCIAFLYFQEKRVDYSIIECVANTKSDYSNVISPTVSVITSIELEHIGTSGNTVVEIAKNKAHIIKCGVPVIIGPCIPEKALNVISEKAKLENSQLIATLSVKGSNFENNNQETARQVLHTMFGNEFEAPDAVFSSPPGVYQQIYYGIKGFPVRCFFDIAHKPSVFKSTLSRCSKDFSDHKIILMIEYDSRENLLLFLQIINEFRQITHVIMYHPSELSKSMLLGLKATLKNLRSDITDKVILEKCSASVRDYLYEVLIGGSDHPRDGMPVKRYCFAIMGSSTMIADISRLMVVNLLNISNYQNLNNDTFALAEPFRKSTEKLAKYYTSIMRGRTRSLAYDPLKAIIKKHLLRKSQISELPLQILDFGCGTGFSTVLIRQACTELDISATVLGVDIDENRIAEAREEENSKEMELYKLIKKNEDLPFPPRTFDMVFSVFVLLEQASIEKMTDVIDCAKKVMKEDGIFVTVHCPTKTYNPDIQWLAMVNDFEQNRKILREKENSSGKKVYIGGQIKNVFRVFPDYFWRNRDYKDVYNKSGMQLLYQVKYKAKDDSKINVIWAAESDKNPYIIHVLKKRVERCENIGETRFLARVAKAYSAKLGLELKTYSQDWILAFKSRKWNTKRMIIGYHFNLNTQASVEICDNKAALSAILTEEAIPNIEHELFQTHPLEMGTYLPAERMYRNILAYAKKYEYNVVLKDNRKGRRKLSYHCKTIKGIKLAVMNILQSQGEVSISPFVNIRDEYRVVVLDGEVKLLFKKISPSIEGNGHDNIAQLLLKKFNQLKKIPSKINEDCLRELNLERIPAEGESILLGWKHKLSDGTAISTDIDDEIKNEVEKLALKAVSTIIIRFASVDIVHTNDELVPLKVLKINSNVVLDSVAKNPFMEEIATKTYCDAILAMFRTHDLLSRRTLATTSISIFERASDMREQQKSSRVQKPQLGGL